MSNHVQSGAVDGAFETPPPRKLKKRVHASVTNLRSHLKRRRQSAPTLSSDDLCWDENVNSLTEEHGQSTATSDRFISCRPKLHVPFNTTPRTNRISKQFNLVDDRILNFKEGGEGSEPFSRDDGTMSLLRKSVSSLFNCSIPSRPTSVMENLHKQRQCTTVLDTPGIPMDDESSPISWGKTNRIAVACQKSVFYQNLAAGTVTQLCTSKSPGFVSVLRWGDEVHENYMAAGMSTGNIEVWDAGIRDGQGTSIYSRNTPPDSTLRAMSLSWQRDMLAAGMSDGEVSLTDIRSPQTPRTLQKHRSRVLGTEWSVNGTHLASGDSSGTVQIWDLRNTNTCLAKLRHHGKTKALAWCPWKPDLLATGSYAPEGKINIWSMSSAVGLSPDPINTLPLNTTVYSLHWSPHCKELLSTHGASFLPIRTPHRRSVSFSGVKNAKASAKRQLTLAQTPLTNSIAVHEYSSGKRLMTLPNAHRGAVTHSCLGPTGENVFTVSPKEETIKLWHVWSARAPEPKQESVFDRYTIR